MYHLHTLIHMPYAYPQICLTRKGNTTIIEAAFLGSGCGRVGQGAGRKVKRMVLQVYQWCGFKARGEKNNIFIIYIYIFFFVKRHIIISIVILMFFQLCILYICVKSVCVLRVLFDQEMIVEYVFLQFISVYFIE